MSRSSGRRAQAEPLAVLVATAVVGAALSAYVGVVPDAMPGERERDVAEPAAERAVERLRDAGVVDPTRVSRVRSVPPAGFSANVSVSARGREWRAGPRPPADAESASRIVPVRVDGRVAPGRVRVEVWT